MIYHGYTVAKESIKDGKLNWKRSGNGATIIALKDGIEYRIKKNLNVKKPSRDIVSKVLRSSLEATASYQEKKQKSIQQAMRGISFTKDHIIVEEDHFWDWEDNSFVTVMRNVPTILRVGRETNNYCFDSLSPRVLLDLFKKMAVQLKTIHDHGIIHGDLKIENFLFVESRGMIDSYLTDFDSSYLKNEVPLIEDGFSIPGTDGWKSPEINYYEHTEDNENSSLITEKTDVFTLGIIYHKLLTGFMPSYTVDVDDPGMALLQKGRIILHKNTNRYIGRKMNATFYQLISYMIEKEPKNRPTMSRVLDILNQNGECKYPNYNKELPMDFDRYYCIPWAKDGILFTTWYRLAKENIHSIERGNEAKGEYIINGDMMKPKTKEYLMRYGLANEIRAYQASRYFQFDAPWDKDSIYFDESSLLEKGVYRIKRDGSKGYILYRGVDEINCDKKYLIEYGYASTKKVEPVKEAKIPNDMWDFDKAIYIKNEEKISSDLSTIKPFIYEGEKGYLIKKKNEDVSRFWNSTKLYQLKYFKRK